MDRKSGIYKITNRVNGKVYVGQSVDLVRRERDHFKALKSGYSHNAHLQRAYNIYGKENFEFSVIEYCPPNELNEKERYYIDYFGAIQNGYNISEGGPGCGRETAIKNLSKAKNNKKPVVRCNDGVIYESASAAARAIGIQSPYISACCLHKGLSAGKSESGEKYVWMFYDEWCLKPAAEIQDAVSHANRDKSLIDIVCVNTGKTYNSAAEASEDTGAPRETILRCLRGKAHSSGVNRETGEGYVWMLLEDYNVLSDDAKCEQEKQSRKPVAPPGAKPVININTGDQFISAASAARSIGVTESCIVACCNGEQMTSGRDRCGIGYRWMYLEDYEDLPTAEREQLIREALAGRRHPRATPVVCINTGDIFATATEAGVFAGVNSRGISACCKGNGNYAGKHPATGEKLRWKYLEE